MTAIQIWKGGVISEKVVGYDFFHSNSDDVGNAGMG